MRFADDRFARPVFIVASLFIAAVFLSSACSPAPRGYAAPKINIKGYADSQYNISNTATTADGSITAVAGAFAVSFQKSESGELIRTVPVGFRADELLFYGHGRYLGLFLKEDLRLYIETATGKRLDKSDIEAKADPPGPVPAAFDFTRPGHEPPKPEELGCFIHQHVIRAAVVPERGLFLAETEGYHREGCLSQPTPQVIVLDLRTFTTERRNGVCSLSLGERRCAVVEGYVGMEGLGGPIFVWDPGADAYLLAHDPRPESDFDVWYGAFDFLPDAGLLCVLEDSESSSRFSLYRGRGGKAVQARDVPIRAAGFRGSGMIHRAASLAMIDAGNGSSRLLYAAFSDKTDTIDLVPIGEAAGGNYRTIDLYPHRNIAVLAAIRRERPLASSIVLFDVKKKAVAEEFPESSCARVSRDETLLAVAGKTLVLYDAESYKKIRELPVDPFMAESIFFSPDKKYLGVCTKDSRVVLYELATGRVAVTLVFTDRGEAIAYTEDNYFMATPGGRKYVGFCEGENPVRDGAFINSFNRSDAVRPALEEVMKSFKME